MRNIVCTDAGQYFFLVNWGAKIFVYFVQTVFKNRRISKIRMGILNPLIHWRSIKHTYFHCGILISILWSDMSCITLDLWISRFLTDVPFACTIQYLHTYTFCILNDRNSEVNDRWILSNISEELPNINHLEILNKLVSYSNNFWSKYHISLTMSL